MAIELDGAGHFTNAGFLNDKERDQKLTELGIKVLRFENVEVFQALETLLDEIKESYKK